MDQDKKRVLGELRTRVINDMIPLVDDNSIDPIERATFLLQIAQSGSDYLILNKAYEAISQIQGEQKLQMLTEILGAIDLAMNNIVVAPENEAVA